MLLVGSASRNAGKTTLACALVESVAPSHAPVAAVKVTIVRQEGQGCPRGDEGCGVCEDLNVAFRISEETPGHGPDHSDTERLLAAGARPVLWLCARPETLASAARALLDRLPRGRPVVCESNGLREVVEPDLFVIVRRGGTTAVKASARAQWELADAIVESGDGQSRLLAPCGRSAVEARFVPDVGDFGFAGAPAGQLGWSRPLRADPRPGGAARIRAEGWTLRRQATGVVLAGGQSTRMQRDKALLPLEGRPLVSHVVDGLRAHVDEVLVSADDAAKYAFLGLPVIADRVPKQGPMMAVASTLEHARHDTVLYAPCDVPHLPAALVARLFRAARDGGDIIVPRGPDGRYEPLFAIYRRSVLPELLRALDAGERRIVRIYDRCDTRVVPVGPEDGLLNVNTAADYAALLGDKTT